MGFEIELKLYDENDEVKGEYRRSFVPFRVLKEAFKLRKWLKGMEDFENLDQEVLDDLARFVTAFFGNRFSVEELWDGAEVSEVLNVITQIMSVINDPNLIPPPA